MSHPKLDRTVVPIWITLATVPATPLIQYALIRFKAPRFLYFLIPALLSILYPVYFYSEPFLLFGTVTMLLLFTFLRTVDVGLLPVSTVKYWSFHEYNEYFYTFFTKQIIKERKAKGMKAGSPHRTLPSDRNVAYYGRWAWKMMVQYAVYHFLIWYMKTYPPNRNRPVRQFTSIFDLTSVVDHLVFGLTFCLMLSLNYNFLFHLICELYQAPFEPIMHSPFLSTSFRDFWSNRWNMTVKENLHRIGYMPTMKVLKTLTPNKRKNWHPPRWYTILGALSSFVISGLIHEWMLLVLVDSPTTWESMLFFLIHGVITVTEVLISKIGKKLFGIDPINDAPKWISIPCTYILFLTTAPFFANPWMRDGLELKLHFPLVWDFAEMLGVSATH